MSTQSAIKNRLANYLSANPSALNRHIFEQLAAQHFHACFSAEQAAETAKKFALSTADLALACVPFAACYALTPVSEFNVGAVVVGASGAFYFGANQEFAGTVMQQTVHAEQSALSHAFSAGEQGLSDIAVNYTPCGHCRQFMNETNSAERLKIHLPHSRDNALHSYLPDAFGPRDLNISQVMFDRAEQPFQVQGDAVECAAIQAAARSYAPYSRAYSGVALLLENGSIVCGSYLENAAFNPSLPPLQNALNFYRLQGLADQKICRIVLAEQKAVLSARALTAELARCYGCEPEYISL